MCVCVCVWWGGGGTEREGHIFEHSVHVVACSVAAMILLA